jgi:hypothetical protein
MCIAAQMYYQTSTLEQLQLTLEYSLLRHLGTQTPTDSLRTAAVHLIATALGSQDRRRHQELVYSIHARSKGFASSHNLD